MATEKRKVAVLKSYDDFGLRQEKSVTGVWKRRYRTSPDEQGEFQEKTKLLGILPVKTDEYQSSSSAEGYSEFVRKSKRTRRGDKYDYDPTNGRDVRKSDEKKFSGRVVKERFGDGSSTKTKVSVSGSIRKISVRDMRGEKTVVYKRSLLSSTTISPAEDEYGRRIKRVTRGNRFKETLIDAEGRKVKTLEKKGLFTHRVTRDGRDEKTGVFSSRKYELRQPLAQSSPVRHLVERRKGLYSFRVREGGNGTAFIETNRATGTRHETLLSAAGDFALETIKRRFRSDKEIVRQLTPWERSYRELQSSGTKVIDPANWAVSSDASQAAHEELKWIANPLTAQPNRSSQNTVSSSEAEIRSPQPSAPHRTAGLLKRINPDASGYYHHPGDTLAGNQSGMPKGVLPSPSPSRESSAASVFSQASAIRSRQGSPVSQLDTRGDGFGSSPGLGSSPATTSSSPFPAAGSDPMKSSTTATSTSAPAKPGGMSEERKAMLRAKLAAAAAADRTAQLTTERDRDDSRSRSRNSSLGD